MYFGLLILVIFGENSHGIAKGPFRRLSNTYITSHDKNRKISENWSFNKNVTGPKIYRYFEFKVILKPPYSKYF